MILDTDKPVRCILDREDWSETFPQNVIEFLERNPTFYVTQQPHAADYDLGRLFKPKYPSYDVHLWETELENA